MELFKQNKKMNLNELFKTLEFDTIRISNDFFFRLKDKFVFFIILSTEKCKFHLL